jgi:hypothetical protein
MSAEAPAASKAATWVGWILGVLPCLVLVASAVMKLILPEPVAEEVRKMGMDDGVVRALGVVELTCTILYLVPRTAGLGAILLTGYLGGAVATHVRMGDAFATPVIVGVMLWLGLYLRDVRLRALVPLRS